MNRLEQIPWLAKMLHPDVLLVIGAISLGFAVATVIVLPFVLTRLPADYLAKRLRGAGLPIGLTSKTEPLLASMQLQA